MKKLFNLLFKSRNEKYLSQLKKDLPKINEIYKTLSSISDEELLNKSMSIKSKYLEEIKNKEMPEDKKWIESEKFLKRNLPEAFALMKEALKREFKIELYDVQLLGGMILHYGNIAEMKTGEGKTYTAILAAYLNALTSETIHVVTVNDYLAQRDAEKVEPVFKRLGLSVGNNIVDNELSNEEQIKIKKENYNKNIVYGTAQNFGFDFLRDNSVYSFDDKVMKERFFAIVDEVDSVLIDEARTPLIISNQDDIQGDELSLYLLAQHIAMQMEVGDIIEKDDPSSLKKIREEKGDLKVDLKSRSCHFTEKGLNKIADYLKKYELIKDENEIYLGENLKIYNMIQTACNANFAYQVGKEYVVKDGKIIMIDEMTGRLKPDQKWSNGFHQALEIKEGVELTSQNKTVAQTTLQHYFNKYKKLSGMTGTADTEANEFYVVYGLETFVVPTNKPIKRKDYKDKIFVTKKRRDEEFIKIIESEHKRGRPILIGTNSVKDNEFYSELLKKHNLPHEVLNAKNHLSEAEIIANAGKKNAITLATNMAGRGTDIILGGNYASIKDELEENIFHSNQYKAYMSKKIEKTFMDEQKEIIELGGLLVVSLGRNESRRVDNQLRGRSGRQGDEGASIFLVSMEDDLLKAFNGDNIKNMLLKFNPDQDQEISSQFIVKQLTNMQKKIEEHFFEIRKNTIKYAQVFDEQTDVIYKLRDDILKTKDFTPLIDEMFNDCVNNFLENVIPFGVYEENLWNKKELEEFLKQNQIEFSLDDWVKENENNFDPENLKELLKSKIKDISDRIKFTVDEKELNEILKGIYLMVIDNNWTEHLTNLNHILQSSSLKGYSGKDPKEIFKKDCFELFEKMLENIKQKIFQAYLNIQKIKGLVLTEEN